jgi:hypothetical protein
MIHLHLMTHVALAIFVTIGILIPIHDKIKSFTWIYFEKTNTYNKKARVIYRIIISLCIVGATIFTIYPILVKGQVFKGYQFDNSLLIGILNMFVVLLNIVFGGYLGHHIAKIFDNK